MPHVTDKKFVGGVFTNTTERDIHIGRFMIPAGKSRLIAGQQIKQSRYAYRSIKMMLANGSLTVGGSVAAAKPAAPEKIIEATKDVEEKPAIIEPDVVHVTEDVEEKPVKTKRRGKRGSK